MNVDESQPTEKKESFTNEPEADALLDYYTAFLQSSSDFPEGTSLYLSSGFRTQAQLIKGQMVERGPEIF